MRILEGETLISSYQKLIASSGASFEPLLKLIKSSGMYALSSVALPLISLVLAPFLTHSLSPTDYGILTLLNTFIGLIAGVTQMGLGSAFFRAYGYDYTASSDRRDVLGTVILLLGLVSFLLVLGIAIMAPFLAHLLLGRPSLGGYLILTAGVVLMQNFSVPGFAWLRAESRAFFYSLLAIGNVFITLIANFVLVGVLHLGLAGSLLATGCGYISVIICTAPLIFLHTTLRIRGDIAYSLLAFGLPLVISSLCSWILSLSDRFLLSIFSSFAETARYAVAYTLGSALSVVILVPFSLAWPTALFAIAKQEDAAQVFKLVFHWFSLVLLFAAFGLTLVGIIVLDRLFPVTYHSGATIIPIVAVSLVFYGLFAVFMVGANVTRKTWLGIIFISIAACVNVAFNLALIPHFGAMGAVVSTLIAYIVLAGVTYAVNQRIYPIPFETCTFLIALLVGIALYIGSDFLGRGFGTYGAWGVSIATLGLYGGCLILIGTFSTWSRKFNPTK